VLVATGRRPYTDGLGLEALGIKRDRIGRIQVDGHFRTAVPNVYAIGTELSCCPCSCKALHSVFSPGQQVM
jgi:pyruvate/2-oxoglutarate dehydrogenase complex dihydrolipoamide dehydrogenase (E3) component